MSELNWAADETIWKKRFAEQTVKPEFFFDERPPRPEVKVRPNFCEEPTSGIRTQVDGDPLNSCVTDTCRELEHLLQENQFCDKQSKKKMERLSSLKGLG